MERSEPGARGASARERLVGVATVLLAEAGPDGVTMRSVAQAAGVQPPVIYRSFGDKAGLLAAVAEQGLATYLERKPPIDAIPDPVEGLRSGWDNHIEFGLDHPAVFRLIYSPPSRVGEPSASSATPNPLEQRVARVAQAGRLKVSERRAVDLISSAGTGVALTLIDTAPADRDLSLIDLAWDAICSVVVADAPVVAGDDVVATAVALRSRLTEVDLLTDAERDLLGEWLSRISNGNG